MLVDQIVRHNARLTPDKLALAAGERESSWLEYCGRVARLAAGLRSLGVQVGDRVAVHLSNCQEYAEAYFAIPWVGAILVPASAKLKPDEVLTIVEDSGSRVIISETALAENLAEVEARHRPFEARVLVDGEGNGAAYGELLERRYTDEERAPQEGRDERDAILIVYTSGTTGRPKGAMLTHRSMMASAVTAAVEREVTRNDRCLLTTPMNHIAAIEFTYANAWAGGAVDIGDKFTPDGFIEFVRSRKVTYGFLVPTMIHMIIDALKARGQSKLNAPSLRLVCYGGAPMSPELLAEALGVFECGFSQAYGLTEASPLLTLLHPEDHLVHDPELRRLRLKSCGREVRHMEVRIVDEGGNPLPPNTPGEVVARGAGVMKGYWQLPGATSETIRAGWLHTGDVAVQDEEGFFYIVGRAKDMIISGGINVYPREVELVIAEHPAVREVAVIGVPDEKWGEVVKAVIVREEGMEVGAEEILAFAGKRLAGHKRPRSIDFADELPRNSAGKVVKTELRDRYGRGGRS